MHAFLQHFIAQLKQWISRVWKDNCICQCMSDTWLPSQQHTLVYGYKECQYSGPMQSDVSVLFLQNSESRSENNSSFIRQLKLEGKSYLFKVMYPAVLHKTTYKHLFTVNTTLLT